MPSRRERATAPSTAHAVLSRSASYAVEELEPRRLLSGVVHAASLPLLAADLSETITDVNPKYGVLEQEHPETADRLPKKPIKEHHTNLPQPVGISVLGPGLAESGFIPPDSVGDVGPAQFIVAANGRIKSFDKATGVLGGLNETTDTFFASVRNNSGTSDPHVRYDRLSGRWFITAINVSTPNRVLIAVSTGSTITGHASFNFFQFQHDLVGTTPNADTGNFADYDTLGVDKFALYIGVNMFNSTGTAFTGTTGFVVNKANLIAGTLTVTPFRQLAGASTAGPYTPQGVDNDDPNATEGYFIGVDNVTFSKLQIRRILNPGSATPTISSNISLNVASTTFPLSQVASGSTRPLDALDDRLFAAEITKNKITGVVSLWTAHNIQVDASGNASNTGGRNGSRWYEIGNLTTTPTLTQSGTLFDPAATSPRGFWIPSIAESGQGAVALASSTAASNQFAGIAAAGRLSTDALGTLQTFTLVQSGAGAYNVQTGGQPTVPQRWGDYSQTVVDPNDDMTFWTFQEYANATNSWGVRAIQLKALAPATPSSASPASVTQGQSNVSVVITGTSSAGTAFFDPGPDTGGPGYANHLTASVSGTGVTVNSVTFTDVTHVTLNLTIAAGAGPGARTVTVTNPDGQSATSAAGILTISSTSTGSIAGQVFEDRNGNGTFDAGDATVNGVPITLGGTGSGSTSTSGSGNYSFAGLADGAYTVTETLPTGYVNTTSLTLSPTVSGGGAVTGQNFGLFPITFTGTSGNDGYSVSATATQETILAPGPLTYTIARSFLVNKTLTFNLGAGDDTLTVNYGTGNPVPTSGGISYDGGSNTATGDKLVVNGTSGIDTNSVTSTDVTVAGSTTTYSTVEGVTVNGLANADAFTVASDSVALTLNGGDGNDTFAVGLLGSLPAVVTINGDNNTDTITLNDSTVGGTDAYTVNGTTVSRTTTFAGLVYASAESLVLKTEAGANAVNVNSTLATTPVSVEANGVDTVTVQGTASGAPVSIFALTGADNVNVNTDNSGIAEVIFPVTQTLAALNIGNGGKATLTSGGSRVLRVASISVAAAGQLDLTDNDLIVDYTGSSPAGAVEAMVASGFDLGDWLGNGITSSVAAAPASNSNFALGVAENNLLVNPFGNGTTGPLFSGQSVDGTAVLVKFTHRVDLDLDGLVTGNDAAVFNGAFSEGDGGATWMSGDVDYDGLWTGNDAAIFNSFYDESLPQI
jgi:hypothetical protein